MTAPEGVVKMKHFFKIWIKSETLSNNMRLIQSKSIKIHGKSHRCHQNVTKLGHGEHQLQISLPHTLHSHVLTRDLIAFLHLMYQNHSRLHKCYNYAQLNKTK